MESLIPSATKLNMLSTVFGPCVSRVFSGRHVLLLMSVLILAASTVLAHTRSGEIVTYSEGGAHALAARVRVRCLGHHSGRSGDKSTVCPARSLRD